MIFLGESLISSQINVKQEIYLHHIQIIHFPIDTLSSDFLIVMIEEKL